MRTQPLYFVERSFGKLGTAFVETSRDRNSRRQVVDDIVSGEIENVLRILEIFEDENSVRDVTEDIARDVADAIEASGDGVPKHLRDFLDYQIGPSTCDELNARAGLFEEVYSMEVV